jgi:hypothetical protein
MQKPIVVMAVALSAAGLTVVSAPSAQAQYYRPGVTIQLGAPYYHDYRPYYAHPPYRPYRVYRPAYVYGGPYAPVCAQWAWRYNRFGERRRYCVAW